MAFVASRALGLGVDAFFAAAEAGPVETLGLHPLHELGDELEPGQLICPFSMKESTDGVTLRAIPAEEQHAFLWTLAEQLKDVPPGGTVRLRLVE